MGDEYNECHDLLTQALNSALESFVNWTAKNWKLEPVGDYSEPEFTPEYRKGWDAAITELKGALNCFMEEYGY